VRGVDGLLEGLGEHGEIGRVPVAVEEEDVMGVYRPDRPFEACIERADDLATGAAGSLSGL
jgi:hypothetical protein